MSFQFCKLNLTDFLSVWRICNYI